MNICIYKNTSVSIMSNENEDPLVEKILNDLHSVIRKHPEISEFDIIHTELNRNKSPVVHIEENLGLESWCLKHVYLYIHRQLIENRRKVSKQKLYYDTPRLIKLLLGGVILNPEVLTYWNLRRELVIENSLNFQNELHITKLVLSYKPKCNECYSYRKWLIQRMLKLSYPFENDAVNFISQEIEIGKKASEKCKNNYHAWNYTLWVVKQLASRFEDAYETILHYQFDYSEIRMTKSVSDYSVFYYRQQIINLITNRDLNVSDKYLNKFILFFKHYIDCRELEKYSPLEILIILLGKPPNDKSEFLVNILFKKIIVLLYDLQLLSELNTLYTCHESIWYHRRYILNELITAIYSYYNVDIPKISNVDQIVNFNSIQNDTNITQYVINNVSQQTSIVQSTLLYRSILDYEKKNLDCSSVCKDQDFDVQRYKKWLMLNLGLSLLDK